jgi:hypothetical protein
MKQSLIDNTLLTDVRLRTGDHAQMFPLSFVSVSAAASNQTRLVNARSRCQGTKREIDCYLRVTIRDWEALMRQTVTRALMLGAVTSGAMLISFPSFPNAMGFVSKPQIVDWTLKRDRLTAAPTPAKKSPTLVRSGGHVPMGCDRAFSSSSSPQYSPLFGRCLV